MMSTQEGKSGISMAGRGSSRAPTQRGTGLVAPPHPQPREAEGELTLLRCGGLLGVGPLSIQPESDDAEGDLERCGYNLLRIRRLKFQNPCSSG